MLYKPSIHDNPSYAIKEFNKQEKKSYYDPRK